MCCVAVLLWNCSSTKHVPDGQYLVDKVSINIEDSADVSETQLFNYLRQIPNHKVLGFLRLQLATYNISGSDTTKWYNRWFQKLGQAPVIYDQSLTDISANQLQLAMINKGYFDATVKVDTITRPSKKKVNVNYTIRAGKPHKVASITYNIPDSAIYDIVMSDTSVSIFVRATSSTETILMPNAPSSLNGYATTDTTLSAKNISHISPTPLPVLKKSTLHWFSTNPPQKSTRASLPMSMSRIL